MSRAWVSVVAALAAVAVAGCASPPKPRASSMHLAQNPPAIVEGRVVDLDGRPAAGVGVRGIPRGEDIPWTAPAVTDCQGRFSVALTAPAAYGFLLSWKGTAVMTSSPDDPALVGVAVQPGGRIEDVRLLFDASAWQRATGAAPEGTPSCQ